MMTCLPTILLSACAAISGVDAGDRPSVLIVVGAAGDEEYGDVFENSAGQWETAARAGGADVVRIGDRPDADDSVETAPSDRELLQQALTERGSASAEMLWIVLIGHGTFDGREAKFNLRGPDVAVADLADWLKPVERPIVLFNCASGSGPFVAGLSGTDRVIVTATRSGDELNFARFGEYLAGAIADPAADLDKDEQVSVLEAFLTASARVEEFYRSAARLATEHALLDDNGDGLGTPADWFQGVRATKRAKEGASPDGFRARQIHLVPSERERSLPDDVRQRRDAIELEIAALREQKSSLGDDEYFGRLQSLMLDLARLYRSVDKSDEP